jgi:cytochrome c oxidase subunit 1
MNLFISLCSVALAAGFLLFCIDVIRSARNGKPAGDNPWGASTLQWATSSPLPPCHFARLPAANSANPLWDEKNSLPVVLGLSVNRRESQITRIGTATPEARGNLAAKLDLAFLGGHRDQRE